jgi:hypothetical protein
MTSSTHIACPNCGHTIDIEELLAHDIEERLKHEHGEQLARERERIEQETANRVRLEADAKIKALEQESAEQRKKAQELTRLQVDHLALQRKLTEQAEELELNVQKRLLAEQQSIEERVRKMESERFAIERERERERYDMDRRELLKQLEDSKKAAEEFRRKSEQGSQQLQGEVQELALEEFLCSRFPHDEISEVSKGQRGADCVQTVYDAGRRCGQIVYESKRTKAFGNDWIDKLKSDMRAQGADIGVIVTETMPKELERFGSINGIWVCTFAEVRPLSAVLRDMLIRVSSAAASQENKGEKMVMLYDYLMSNDFRMTVENVMEAFLQMRADLDRERTAMERMWKQREKQLQRVTTSMSHMMGSIQGIAGKDLPSVPSFELPAGDDTPSDD